NAAAYHFFSHVSLRRSNGALMASNTADRESESQSKGETMPFSTVRSTDPRMREIFELISGLGQTNSTVLIEGETGTGKEVIAAAVHAAATHRTGPFVAVNCAALPETLLESELFGHEKGAFTSAVGQRQGRFELAHGG